MVRALKTTSSELFFLKLMKSGGRCQPCWKKTCLAYDLIRTTTIFTTEAFGETFKIQSATLNCNSEKGLFLLKWKVGSEAP